MERTEGYLEGHCLIAMPQMGDTRFERAVVFLCAHSAEGAMGIVVNKPAANVSFVDPCDRNHLPGFLSTVDAITDKGVDEVAVVAVNDVFVMDAWSKASGAQGKITFLADGSATFTQAVGLDIDASGFGMGLRSARYSMLVEDGVVKILNVEESPGSVEKSGAEALMAAL